jgi:hypothetical protein
MNDTPNAHALTCPCCGLLDQTQRVTSAYRAGLGRSTTSGTATGVSYYGDGRVVPTVSSFGATTTQQSALSRLLAPPPGGHRRVTERRTRPRLGRGPPAPAGSSRTAVRHISGPGRRGVRL